MPVLTDVQSYAAGLLRSLHCICREDLHRMIGGKFPAVTPEKIMRQLTHVLRVYDDGVYYRWQGTEPNPERAAAVGVMLEVCKGVLPIIGEVPRYPCALLFFVPTANGAVLPYRVYTPKSGDEATCRTKAENEPSPKGHAVVFVIADKSCIPLLRISRPHIFALKRHNEVFEFLEARVK